jgi:hypothetical protein
MARFDVNRPFLIATLGLAVGAAIRGLDRRSGKYGPTCRVRVPQSLLRHPRLAQAVESGRPPTTPKLGRCSISAGRAGSPDERRQSEVAEFAEL